MVFVGEAMAKDMRILSCVEKLFSHMTTKCKSWMSIVWGIREYGTCR